MKILLIVSAGIILLGAFLYSQYLKNKQPTDNESSNNDFVNCEMYRLKPKEHGPTIYVYRCPDATTAINQPGKPTLYTVIVDEEQKKFVEESTAKIEEIDRQISNLQKRREELLMP